MAGTKNNTAQALAIAIILIAMLFLVYYFFFSGVSWTHSYDKAGKEPYDTYLIHHLLQNTRGNQEFILIDDSTARQLPIDPGSQVDNYVYFGKQFFADSADISRLMQFAESGNNVFIFCEDVESYFLDSLTVAWASYPAEEILDESSNNEVPLDVQLTFDQVNPDYEDTDFTDEHSPKEDTIILQEEPDNLYGDDELEIEIEPEAPNDLREMPRIYYSTDSSITLYTTSEHASLTQPEIISCELSEYYKFEIRENNWPYFSDELQLRQGSKPEIMGYYDQGYQNYIRFRFGKGYIYLHSTPQVFTNYYLREEKAMQYCRAALSYLGDGKIYWDEENQTYDSQSSRRQRPSTPPAEGPLEFILSEPGLRTAWYLLLLSALLYLIFGAKRKQRIIQKMDKMDNTSIEYAEVLSQLFLKQTDHYRLVLMKMDLFRSFLRYRYGARLSEEQYNGQEEELKQIAIRSGVQPGLLEDIFRKFNSHKKSGYVEYSGMMEFHEMLEYFYKNCK